MMTSNMHTHRTSNMNTNLTMNMRLTTNVFPVKHDTNTNRVFVNNFVNELPKPPLRLWQQPLCGGEIVEKLNPNTITNVCDEIVVKFKFNARNVFEANNISDKNVFVFESHSGGGGAS